MVLSLQQTNKPPIGVVSSNMIGIQLICASYSIIGGLKKRSSSQKSEGAGNS